MRISLLYPSIFLMLCACSSAKKNAKDMQGDVVQTETDSLYLPKPFDTKNSVKFSEVIGWKDGQKPTAPEGFEVIKYADNLRSVRWIYVLDNGDVLVSQANTEPKSVGDKVKNAVSGRDDSQNIGGSPDQITLLRDADNDGKPELVKTFLSGLNQPFGMLQINDKFYVANTDGLYMYPYKEGETSISGTGKKILDLPAGGYNNHWTRNLITNADKSKIYISVGSGSNVGENGMEYEVRRANILEINPDGSNEIIYASGLRNPVGMGWAPGTSTLWTAVNERDGLGDDLVPDYATSVKKGGFYGWPYAYLGKHKDPRFNDEEQRMDLVNKTIVPDLPLGSHTASLGLAFNTGNNFPERYKNGMFIGQHGSWNRSEFVGYKVVFIPFKNGKPAGKPEDFLTGFIANRDKSEVYGRPVGVTFLPNGAMLVADDASNTVWCVRKKK